MLGGGEIRSTFPPITREWGDESAFGISHLSEKASLLFLAMGSIPTKVPLSVALKPNLRIGVKTA